MGKKGKLGEAKITTNKKIRSSTTHNKIVFILKIKENKIQNSCKTITEMVQPTCLGNKNCFKQNHSHKPRKVELQWKIGK
jgi:hypothetical protein